jgi:thymidylate synthase
MEALWMLHGDNDIEFPCYFNSTYGQWSDDGVTMWDAYGFRWRRFFGWDQLDAIVEELMRNPNSRQGVLSMWNAWPSAGDYDQNRTEFTIEHDELASHDFYVATHGGKAVPCNTAAYVDLRGGKLNLTVTNRSNDLIWGCYGANVVHMSFLAEYLAARLRVPVGVYRQFSNNLHVYTSKFSCEQMRAVALECAELLDGEPLPETGVAIGPEFDAGLPIFMEWARRLPKGGAGVALNVPDVKDEFLQLTAVPMILAWYYRKQKDAYSMYICLDGIEAPDWQKACRDWVERRAK